MLDVEQRQAVDARLARIEGQVRGIRKMIGEERYCIDILNQTSAVVSALRAVEDMVLNNHLSTCVASAMQSEDAEDKQRKIDEIMAVFGRYRKNGTQG